MKLDSVKIAPMGTKWHNQMFFYWMNCDLGVSKIVLQAKICVAIYLNLCVAMIALMIWNKCVAMIALMIWNKCVAMIALMIWNKCVAMIALMIWNKCVAMIALMIWNKCVAMIALMIWNKCVAIIALMIWNKCVAIIALMMCMFSMVFQCSGEKCHYVFTNSLIEFYFIMIVVTITGILWPLFFYF